MNNTNNVNNKQYRILGNKEIIQEGDQFLDIDNVWNDVKNKTISLIVPYTIGRTVEHT
jgi:hypothetical protein